MSEVDKDAQDVPYGDEQVAILVCGTSIILDHALSEFGIPYRAFATTVAIGAVEFGCGWQEYGVDDVDDSIVRDDVCDGYLCIIDEDVAFAVEADFHVSPIEGGGGGPIGQIGGEHLGTDDVVEQNVGKAVECEQILCGGIECGGQGDEGVVGRCEDGERTFTGEGFSCLLYTSPSPRDGLLSRMPSSA